MRTYEALYIVKPDLKDDDVQALAEGVKSIVTEGGGAIVHSEIWGKRRLAYEVETFSEGCYVLLRFESPPDLVPRIENHFRLTEDVIRYLVVVFDEKTLRLEAEQLRKAEEDAQSRASRGERDREESPRRSAPARGARSGSRGSFRRDDEEEGAEDSRDKEEEE